MVSDPEFLFGSKIPRRSPAFIPEFELSFPHSEDERNRKKNSDAQRSTVKQVQKNVHIPIIAKYVQSFNLSSEGEG